MRGNMGLVDDAPGWYSKLTQMTNLMSRRICAILVGEDSTVRETGASFGGRMRAPEKIDGDVGGHAPDTLLQSLAHESRVGLLDQLLVRMYCEAFSA